MIGPNLAASDVLCGAVAKHIYRDFFYPYLLQQQRLWETWDRIDDAFRVKGKAWDLDQTATDQAVAKKNPDVKADGNVGRDGVSAKVYPAAMHRQIRNKTDMHMSIAWADGAPVRALVPETVYEHPLYNPATQKADATNELLRQAIEATRMKERDRRVRGSWSKYGHAWVHTDFSYRFKDVQDARTLPPNPQAAMMLIQAVAMQQYGGQPPQFGFGPNGERQAIWTKRIVDGDSMLTDFMPLRHDAVFIDQTLTADDMDRQPCPIVRSHVTRFDLWGNDYDPQLNPFGWLNARKALARGQDHYTLSAPDEATLRAEMANKYGLSDAGVLKPRNSVKQLWTCYPMLAIDPATGLLDEGDGIQCPTCRGAKQINAATMRGGAPAQYSTMPDVMPPVVIGAGGPTPPVMQAKQDCPDCQGEGKQFIPPARYVVQMFGLMQAGGDAGSALTVLRIQRNPTVNDHVPLIFGAHLTEDTAGAIPVCVSEAALPANDQLATAHNQVLDAKNQGINRQWQVQEDEPCLKMDLNRANRNIPVTQMGNAVPAPTIAYDITANLTREYIPMQEGEVQDIIGIPPVLMGMVSQGRRAATEIQTSSDAAKLPITVEIDSCNTQIHGRWARRHLENLDQFADRDWIRDRTGRTSFGDVKLYTEVAGDFFTKQAQLQLLQNFLPVGASVPGFNVARAAQEIFSLAGFSNASEFIDDGGARKAQMDAFRIIADILGEGKVEPPNPWDPHQIYIQCFQQALMDPEWRKRSPEMMPILEQRMAFQQALLQQQQQQQFAAQMQQQMLMAQATAGPQRGPNPRKPSQIPENATQAAQQQAGRSAQQ